MAVLPQAIDDDTLRLLIASGLGPSTRRRLRQTLGSDRAVVHASATALARVEGVDARRAGAIRRGLDEADPTRERARMGEIGVRLILEGHADYPPLLAAIPEPPDALWLRGEITVADNLALAIVGSRACTPYGRDQTGRFASLLAQCGLTIVSGGARGIDAEAHRAALRVGGRTVAVLGCGLAVCYPAMHASLFDQIVASGGGLLSEYPMERPPLASHFPRRNRIISGLSLGVLVIEAAARSGALITAHVAAEQHGREVMVVPGRVDSPASRGGLGLLQEGAAACVVDHLDVIRQLEGCHHLVKGAFDAFGGDTAAGTGAASDGVARPSLTEDQRAVVTALAAAAGPVTIEQLAARTGRSMGVLAADITVLEIRGYLRRDHRGVTVRSR